MKNLYQQYRNIAWVIVLFFAASGCEGLLDQEPLTTPVVETFYSNETEVTLAVNAIYDILNGSLYRDGNPVALIQMEDNIYKGTNPNDGFGLSQINSLDWESTNPWMYDWYRYLYQGINRANVAIERITVTSPDQVSEDAKTRLVAESKFLRGLFYFYLVRLYGEVPVILQSASDADAPGIPKSPEADVWDQIEQDFLAAIPDLPATYGGSNIGRVTSGAAKCFLGQVYMWTERSSEALTLFDEVIQSNLYSLEPEFLDNFLETNFDSPETVFAVQYANLGSTAESTSWIKYTGVRGQRPLVTESGYGWMVGTQELLDNYDDGDVRREVSFWEQGEASPTNPSATYLATSSSPFHLNATDVGPMKWWWANEGYYNTSSPNLALIRYADVLLYYAEAANDVNNGPTQEAYDAINQVKDRAKVGDLPLGLNESEFFDAVLRERRAEFVFEFQRWWDLARTQRADEFFASSVYKAGKFNPAKHYKWPLPQIALERNKALIQNTAYNGTE